VLLLCFHQTLLHTNENLFHCCCCRYDLLVACKEIGEGSRAAPELLGDNVIKPILASDAYQKRLDSKRVNNSQILSLLERYSARKTFAETH
jgi:hypothetical protein